jgi:diguanylate cyclase (GGDEF)-like protein
MDRVDQAIKKHERNGEIFAVLFVDLDHFKEINDSFGHDVGDSVLQEAAIRLQNVIRDMDTVSRWGGDEFVILLEHIKKPQDIVNIADKILEEFRKKIIISKEVFFISISVGISMYPDDGDDIGTLLKNADAAMYKAKDEGRNNYQFYAKEMTTLAFEKVVLETELRNAIENNELRAYYQAQIDLKTSELIGAEALVRWEHPSLGLVSPVHFIPLAEESDLIVYLGNWMLEETMSQMVKWIADGLKPKKVSVNLAAKQIVRKDLVPTIKALLDKTTCRAEYLELEVTEGFIMKNPEIAIDNLNKLREMGIEIAIDDFGTGYSSLSYLKKLPITKLKIDQSFVRDIETDEDDKAIVKSVIALSHGLGLTCIAEGVETIAQKEYLISEACDEMQGYLYAKPLPSDEYKQQILT